jgi:hypothetical protein
MAQNSDVSQPVDDQKMDELPIDELRRRAARAQELIAEVYTLFPHLRRFTADERRYSQGRLREGEAEMLGTMVDIIDNAPQYFVSLADQDEGHDPERLETGLLRERLERRMLINGISKSLDPLTQGLADETLYLGGLTRPVLLAAYRIAKPISKSDVTVANRLAPVIDFYSEPARAAAATRARQEQRKKDK